MEPFSRTYNHNNHNIGGGATNNNNNSGGGHAATNTRLWTPANNNGFFVEQRRRRPETPGNISLLSTISGRLGSPNGVYPPLTVRPSQVTSLRKTPPAQNTNFVGIQSRFRRKYYRQSVFGTLILLVIILLIAIIVMSVTHPKSPAPACHSKECLRSAASLIYTMNQKVDPCEDFYQFACGNWGTEHPRPDSVTSNDWFRERQATVVRSLRDFLKANHTDSEPEAVGKTKTMYRACMNTRLMDKIDLDPLVHFLRVFELPLLPSIFNLTLSTEAAKTYEKDLERKFSWLRTLVLVKRHLGLDLIFGFDILPDPFNRTINRIAFGTPETDSSLPFNADDLHKLLRKKRKQMLKESEDDDDDEEGDDEHEAAEEAKSKGTTSGLSAYVVYIQKIVEMYLAYLDPKMEYEEDHSGSRELAMQAVKFARTIFRIKDEVENTTKSKNPIDDVLYLTIADLQNQTNKPTATKPLTIWTDYLDWLMEGIDLKPPLNGANLTIITSQADITYIQATVEFMEGLPPSTVEAFVWLSVVEELIVHTTSDMRLIHSEYMRYIVGTEGSTPRSLYCSHAVNSLMGMAVSYSLIDEHFTRHKLPRVHSMLGNIRHSFDNLVRSTNWMDAATKQETLKKSANMKSFIGYPDWLTNASALNEHYAGVHANESTHLENMIGVLAWNMQQKLQNYHVPEPLSWATSPSHVNAFHTFQANAITIPIAILSYPFYDLGLEALNYGAIGTILGHELTHGFDDSGRMFDKDGNMLPWWSNETIKEYVNRTDCFVDQYSHYYLDDVGEYIDGELTLGENIADNGGMREAFHAYRLFTHRNGANGGPERARLPGLEEYTHEQLFFISFGNLWCETYTPAASRYALEDAHCPGKIRLKGVLSNSEEFAATFKCRRGSGMNPAGRKCRVW